MFFNKSTDNQSSAIRRVYEAIKDGVLTRPSCCEDCGALCTPEAHHSDYLKPLEVSWLCVRCHKLWHKNHGEAANRQTIGEVIEADLLTPSEVCLKLRVSPPTLSRWRKQGTGPKWQKIGNKLIRYRAIDLMEWIDAG